MNSKKIVALLLCLGLSFQSTALSGVLYDENAVVKASAEESGKTADAESYSGTEQSENKAQQPESSADKADKTQHAYDPISDMEAEQEYRDSTEITPGKVLFSVLSYHAKIVYFINYTISLKQYLDHSVQRKHPLPKR